MRNIDVRKETNAKYRKHLGYSLSYGAFYAFIVIACLAIAYLLPETLIVTIPVIIIPFAFAFQFNTSIDNATINDQGFSLKRFFKLFSNYWQRPFYGVYRILIGFLKALGVFLVVYIFVGAILINKSLAVDADLLSLVSSIENMPDGALVDQEIISALIANESVLRDISIASGVAFFPSVFIFMHHIGVNSIKMHLSVASGKRLPMSEVNLIHRMGFSSFRRDFYKDYYKTVWWFIPCLIVTYFGGFFMCYYLFYESPADLMIAGLAITMLFLSFTLPYYFSCIETLFFKYQDKYIEASIDQSIKTLNQLKAQNKMSKEEEEEIEKYINQTKDYLEQANKENAPEEQKNSDDSES